MRSSTWRPERRNRRIGTASAGVKPRLSMRIPESRQDRLGDDLAYWSRLSPDSVRKLEICDQSVTILYERPAPGFAYGCSVDDLVHLLPQLDLGGLPMPDFFVFRQSTRKQKVMEPVWGRLVYFYEYAGIWGSAVLLEAQDLSSPVKWGRKLRIDEQAELERLRRDGHRIVAHRRGYNIHLTERSFRNKLLYRTLLHELGHWVDYCRAVAGAEDEVEAWDLYHARPSRQKEDFAHRFADDMAAKLRKRGVIPFAPRDRGAPGNTRAVGEQSA